MAEIIGKPCVLILRKQHHGDEIDKRVYVMEDHKEALDLASHFAKAGYDWSLYNFEHLGKGEKPSNMPIVQKRLWETESS
jgi:hypothetical protein